MTSACRSRAAAGKDRNDGPGQSRAQAGKVGCQFYDAGICTLETFADPG